MTTLHTDMPNGDVGNIFSMLPGHTDSDCNLATSFDTLARLAVNVGIGPDIPTELVIRAPLEAAVLVRKIALHAYTRGVRHVNCLYDDPLLLRERLIRRSPEELDQIPSKFSSEPTRTVSGRSACIDILAPYPTLLSGVDIERIVQTHKNSYSMKRHSGRVQTHSSPNTVLPFVTMSWAQLVFPDLKPDTAMQALWKIIFAACRTDEPDPEVAWKEHELHLARRRDRLQESHFRRLHIRNSHSNLYVNLAEGHRWQTAIAPGILRTLPAEAVYTCPHSSYAEGTLYLTRPIALAGQVVEGVCLKFCAGRLVSAYAEKGQDILDQLLTIDETASRLGKVALVSSSSPLAAFKLPFFCALLDTNTGSYLTLGQHDAECLMPGTDAEGAGANNSALNLDCIYDQLDSSVDGIRMDGTREPLMRNGKFLF